MMAIVLRIAVCFGIFGVIFTQRLERPRDCEECDPSLCDTEGLSGCVAGTVLDRCSCCEVCAKAEFEICDLLDSADYEKSKRRTCGNNLECRQREDLSFDISPQAICYCMDDDPICASNGITYDNKCQFEAAKVVTQERYLEKKFDGPCNSAPVIVSGPEDVKNNTHSVVYISCEAKGFPVPEFHWIFTRADGKTVSLPYDDPDMSVNQRGGPGKREATSWLIIMNLKKVHEGDYTCIAQNDVGASKDSARVIVMDEKDYNYDYKRSKKFHHNEI